MGSTTFSGAYGSHFRIEVNYGLVSQNIANNTSVVRVWVKLYSDGYSSMYGVTAPLALEINGGAGIENVSVNINRNSNITLFVREYTIGHEADGTKTMNIRATLVLNRNGYGEGGWGTNYTLPTIPRASTSSDISGILGTPLTININRASDSFTHNVRYNYGSLSGTIATGVDTSLSWTPPLSLATTIPNTTTNWGIFTIDTYNGDTMIGSTTYKMTLTIPDSVIPTLGSITLTDTNTTAKNLLNTSNIFVQNQSNIQVTFNSASGDTGSSITTYRAQIVNKGNNTTGNNSTLGTMNYSGTVTVEAWVIDSRGRSSAKKTQQITILPYTAPALYFTASRGNDTASSNKIIVSRTAQISRLLVNNVQKNTFKLEFDYSAYNVTAHTTDTGANIAQTTGTYSITRSNATMAANFDVGKSYKIYGRLTDAFSSTDWIEYEIHPESMVMGMAETTVSFGKYPELTEAVDSMWKYYYNNKPIQNQQLTNMDECIHVSDQKDWNKITTAGFYMAYNMANAPAGTNMDTWQYVRVSKHNDKYVLQELVDFNGVVSAFRVMNNSTWSDWQYYAVQNKIANFKSVYQDTIYRATIPGPYGLNIQASRSGNIVNGSINSTFNSTGSFIGTATETIPLGFRPNYNQYINNPVWAGSGVGSQMWTGDNNVQLHYFPTGRIDYTIRTVANPVAITISFTWITSDPFPQ